MGAGVCRSTPAIIRASRVAPLAAHKIRLAMDDLLFEYDLMLHETGPLRAIPWFHAAFERMHPFADGNGRSGRLLMNYQLMAAGYPPIAIKVDNSVQYKTALEEWQVDGHPLPFIELFSACLRDELSRRIGFLEACALPVLEEGRSAVPRNREVLDLLASDSSMTASAIAERIGISQRQVQRILKALKEEGTLRRGGSNKSGHWEVIDLGA